MTPGAASLENLPGYVGFPQNSSIALFIFNLPGNVIELFRNLLTGFILSRKGFNALFKGP